MHRIRGKYVEAEELLQRALTIRSKVLGSEHPETINSLNNLARLREAQGKYVEAGQIFLRIQTDYESILGSEHPYIVNSREDYIALLYKTNNGAAAATLEEHAQAVQAKQSQ